MDVKRFTLLPVVIALSLLLPPLCYVGSYYSTVQRSRIEYFVFVRYDIPGDPIPDVYLQRFFAPMHWLDCRLRPTYWSLNYVEEVEEFHFAPTGQ